MREARRWSWVRLTLAAGLLAAAGRNPAGAEAVAVFAADCATPTFIFTQGDTVCAQVFGVTLPGASRFVWIAADATVAFDGPTVTSDPQSTTFTIPPNLVQAKRGSWQINVLRNSDDTPLAGGSFAVIEGVRLFAADCTTPRSIFALGDTVCAVVANRPASVNLNLQWIDPSFALLGSALPVSSDPQSFTVAIPTSGPQALTGTWLARTSNQADASGRYAAPFTVVAAISPLTVAKTFDPATIAPGATSTLTVTIANPNPFPAHASFTDTYPAGLFNATPAGAATTCAGGTVAAGDGGGTLQLTNGTVPAAGSCTVSVAVTGTGPGTLVNGIAAGSVTTSEGPANDSDASAQLEIVAPNVVIPALSPPGLAILALVIAGGAWRALRRR